MKFALWVKKVAERGTDNSSEKRLGGYYLYLEKKEMKDKLSFEGDIQLLSPKIQQVQPMYLVSAHIEGWPYSGFLASNVLEISPPYLLTNIKETRIIYQGKVQFKIDEKYKHLMPRRGSKTLPIASGDWFGVLEIESHGLFRQKVTTNLLAFTNKKVEVESGKIFSSIDQNILIGYLAIEK